MTRRRIFKIRRLIKVLNEKTMPQTELICSLSENSKKMYELMTRTLIESWYRY